METSISLDEELAAYVEEISDAAGDNNAEAIREAILRARDLDQRISFLLDDLEEAHSRINQLSETVDRLEAESQTSERVKRNQNSTLDTNATHATGITQHGPRRP